MFHALVGDNKLFNRAEIESGDAGALPCAPSLPIRPEKIGQIWSRYYRGQAISNKAVTLRATLGDQNQGLNSGGKGIIKGTRFHKVSRISIRLFHQAASGWGGINLALGIPLCNTVQMGGIGDVPRRV